MFHDAEKLGRAMILCSVLYPMICLPFYLYLHLSYAILQCRGL